MVKEEARKEIWQMRKISARLATLQRFFLFLIEELINEPYGFILLLVYNLSVYLGGGDVCMTQQLACRVDVGSQCKHHRCKGMSGAMHNLSKSNGK